jgi:hypothetical protein
MDEFGSPQDHRRAEGLQRRNAGKAPRSLNERRGVYPTVG